MKWIGLTGGIATGKSTVARLIESRGVPIIDADKIAHQALLLGTPIYENIVKVYGETILRADLHIDRKKLGEIVFNDDHKKSHLEQIIHPYVKEKVSLLKDEAKSRGHKVAFYDIPLLFEKNLQTEFDQVWVVWCDAETQRQRLMKRNGWTKDEADLRIQQQLPISYKIKNADICIDNSGDDINLIHLVDYFMDGLLGF